MKNSEQLMGNFTLAVFTERRNSRDDGGKTSRTDVTIGLKKKKKMIIDSHKDIDFSVP